jgi:hypothetical protein
MADEQNAQARKQRRPSKRININISAEAFEMLEEMGEALYPSILRTDGIVVDAALREKYAAFKKSQEKPS